MIQKKKKISGIPVQDGTLTYNGSKQTAVFGNFNETELYVTGNTGTDAGTYTAIFTPKADYCWSDESEEPKSITWTIEKAEGTLTLDKTEVVLSKIETSTTVNISNASGDISVSSSNHNIATVSVLDNVITITSNETDGNVTITVLVSESKNYSSIAKAIYVQYQSLKIVTFADGTDEEIQAMVEAHYNGDINIQNYWAVGDIKEITLEAIASQTISGTSIKAHRKQTIKLVIGDFGHDSLETNYKSHSNAAITILQKDCLMDSNSEVQDGNGWLDTERDMISELISNRFGWKTSAIRTWLNNYYLKALPIIWQNMIKKVQKQTTAGNNSTSFEYSYDWIFLPSEYEVFGSIKNAVRGEGSQYKYYKISSNNVCKLPRFGPEDQYKSQNYWLRSPYKSSSTSTNYRFCYVSWSGSVSDANESDYRGIAPCFCI